MKLNMKKVSFKKSSTKELNEWETGWEKLHSAFLSFNTRTSSTALQAFLHYVTLMNEAVMSLCSSQAIQLSSDMLQPLGCVRESVCEWVTDPQACRNSEFIPEGHHCSLWNTREWWSDPWRRCEKAKQREREREPAGLFIKSSFSPSHCHLQAPTHHKTAHINSQTAGIRLDLWAVCTASKTTATLKVSPIFTVCHSLNQWWTVTVRDGPNIGRSF